MNEPQKVKYGTKELAVKSINASDYKGIDTIEITFNEGVAFADVQAFYDTNRNADTLRRMEVYTQLTTYEPVIGGTEGEVTAINTWALQRVHIGYTKPIDISCFGGVIKAKIERELEVESTVAVLQNDVDILTIAKLESEGIL